jgi:hypothetical protein
MVTNLVEARVSLDDLTTLVINVMELKIYAIRIWPEYWTNLELEEGKLMESQVALRRKD